MIEQRDLRTIAHGIGMAGTMPSNAERRAAIAALEAVQDPEPIVDPALFAKNTYWSLSNDDDIESFGWVVMAEEQGAFAQARAALYDAEPHLRTVPFEHPINEFDNQMMDLFYAAYEAGLRHGAAYEHLRRSVVGEVIQCRPCVGLGANKAGECCCHCGGTGTVALRAVTSSTTGGE